MSKIQCEVCGCIAFTASPRNVSCKCGGTVKVIPETRAERLSMSYASAVLLSRISKFISHELNRNYN